LKESRISIGTARIGIADYGVTSNCKTIDQKTVDQILSYAYDNGVNSIDTARAYGNAENKIGASSIQEKFHINTKLRKKQDLDDSLEAMKTNRVHSCMIHSFDDFVDNKDLLHHLLYHKHRGTIKKVGFSLYYPDQLEFLLDNAVEFDIVQLPYNICDTRFKDLISDSSMANVEIHARSCFLQGSFFMKKPVVPLELCKKISLLQNYAKSNEIDIDKILLDFCLSNESIDKIVLGVDSVKQLARNIEISQQSAIEIQTELVEAMSSISELAVIPMEW